LVTIALAFVAAALGVYGAGMLLTPRRAAKETAPAGRAPALLRLLGRFGASLAKRAAPADVEHRIAAAGRPAGVSARELMAAKAGAALLATLPGASFGALAPGRLGLLIVVGAPVGAFFAPDMWLARRAAERARSVRRSLPELLDLLRITVDAGTALHVALLSVGERASGPLATEWRAVGREASLGVPLADALEAMEARLPLAEVRTLARALDRTRRHGVPLGATLASQAQDARLALSRRVEEDAAKAGPKIQLVVALLLVPSVLLLVAAALIAALSGSGGAGLSGWG
jgi:tight adherence protein C